MDRRMSRQGHTCNGNCTKPPCDGNLRLAHYFELETLQPGERKEAVDGICRQCGLMWRFGLWKGCRFLGYTAEAA